ncbi:MAG: hypothetical protein FGF50_11915 [Candidatus Brockarchaeota archaeon]|nr:hypothetical protein [Candidatus Brockarchaeota archaeon]
MSYSSLKICLRISESPLKKIVKTPPEPAPLSTNIWLHEAKLRYIPVIEVSAIKGKCTERKILEYLESRVEVKRGEACSEKVTRDERVQKPYRIITH